MREARQPSVLSLAGLRPIKLFSIFTLSHARSSTTFGSLARRAAPYKTQEKEIPECKHSESPFLSFCMA